MPGAPPGRDGVGWSGVLEAGLDIRALHPPQGCGLEGGKAESMGAWTLAREGRGLGVRGPELSHNQL